MRDLFLTRRPSEGGLYWKKKKNLKWTFGGAIIPGATLPDASRWEVSIPVPLVSHEGRKRVSVTGHILVLREVRFLKDFYCQAVLLFFFFFVFKHLDLYLTFSYSICCCTILLYLYSESMSIFVLWQFPCISASFSFHVCFFNNFGGRCCFTPVRFLYCGLPLTGLSPQQGPVVWCFLQERKHGPSCRFNSNKQYVFREPRMPLSHAKLPFL